MNKTAQKLGRMAKGKEKKITDAERKRRAESLAIARQKRWPEKQNPSHHAPPLGGGSVHGVVLRPNVLQP